MTTLTHATSDAAASDPYARSADLDDETADALATRLEVRRADPQQRALRQCFLSRIPRRAGTSVLEAGCGTGIVAHEVAALPGIDTVVGVDPSPQFIERARATVDGDSILRFEIGDGRALNFGDASFDVVVFATTLCHVIDPRAALDEAFRVLVSGGTLLVFDGDSRPPPSPLPPTTRCRPAWPPALARLVYDPWLVRKLPTLLANAGFRDLDMESHGYVETTGATYTPTIVDFGVAALATESLLGADAAEALKTEARRRIHAGTYFGHIAYASVLATRP